MVVAVPSNSFSLATAKTKNILTDGQWHDIRQEQNGGVKKKKSDTALEIVWICGEYMSEDYLGHFGPFRQCENGTCQKKLPKNA